MDREDSLVYLGSSPRETFTEELICVGLVFPTVAIWAVALPLALFAEKLLPLPYSLTIAVFNTVFAARGSGLMHVTICDPATNEPKEVILKTPVRRVILSIVAFISPMLMHVLCSPSSILGLFGIG